MEAATATATLATDRSCPLASPRRAAGPSRARARGTQGRNAASVVFDSWALFAYLGDEPMAGGPPAGGAALDRRSGDRRTGGRALLRGRRPQGVRRRTDPTHEIP